MSSRSSADAQTKVVDSRTQIDSRMLRKLEALIRTGKQLVPHGGVLYQGHNKEFQAQYMSWRMQSLLCMRALRADGESLCKEIETDRHGSYFYRETAERVLACLRTAAQIARSKLGISTNTAGSSGLELPSSSTDAMAAGGVPSTQDSTARLTEAAGVLVVAGEDEQASMNVVEVLERLELGSAVVHPHDREGRAAVESLEAFGTAGFVVFVVGNETDGELDLTGGYASSPTLTSNLAFELGYFAGRLGPKRVLVLASDDQPTISGGLGLTVVTMDPGGLWHFTLAKTLKTAGLNVDLNRVT